MEMADKVRKSKSVSNPSPEDETKLLNGNDCLNLFDVLNSTKIDANRSPQKINNEFIEIEQFHVSDLSGVTTRNLPVSDVCGPSESKADPDFHKQLNLFEETIKTSAKVRNDAVQSFSAFVRKQQEIEEYFNVFKESLKAERMKKEAEFDSVMSNINLYKMGINEELIKTQEKLATSELSLRQQSVKFSNLKNEIESIKRKLGGMKEENESLKTELATSEMVVSKVRTESELAKKEFEAEINGLNRAIKLKTVALEELNQIVTRKDKERQEESANFLKLRVEFKQLQQKFQEKENEDKKQTDLIIKYVAEIQQLQDVVAQTKTENEKLRSVSQAKTDHLVSLCTRSAELKQLQESLSAKEENIAECQNEIAELNSTIVQLQEQLEQKSKENKRLQFSHNQTNCGKFSSKQENLEIKELNLALVKKKKHIHKLEEILSNKHKAVNICEKKLAENERYITNLRSKMREKIKEIGHFKEELERLKEKRANECQNKKLVEENSCKEELKKQVKELNEQREKEPESMEKRVNECQQKLVGENSCKEETKKQYQNALLQSNKKISDLQKTIFAKDVEICNFDKTMSEQSTRMEELNKIISKNESNLKEQNDTIVCLYLKVDQLEALKAAKLNPKLEFTKSHEEERRTEKGEVSSLHKQLLTSSGLSSSHVLSSGGAACEKVRKNYKNCKGESLTMCETKTSHISASWEMELKEKDKRICALNGELQTAKWEITNLKSQLDRIPNNGFEKDTYNHQQSFSDRKRKRYYH